MTDNPIHLWTGITVCGHPKSWCGAELKVEGNLVRNATATEAKCTCEVCIAALNAVREEAKKLRRDG
jgi:hypothetical protein